MQKALLISILAATLLIPIFASRGGSVRKAVRRSAIATCIFCVLYWLGLLFVYPSLSPPTPTQNPMQGATQQ